MLHCYTHTHTDNLFGHGNFTSIQHQASADSGRQSSPHWDGSQQNALHHHLGQHLETAGETPGVLGLAFWFQDLH